MTCEDLIERLVDYLSDDLTQNVSPEAAEHLRRCRDCLAYLRSYRTTVLLVRGSCIAGEDEAQRVPDDLVRSVVAVLPQA